MSNGPVIINTPEGIEFVQMVARRGALKLETKGMKRHGQSAYSICKQVYGLKGNKLSVLAQMDKMIADVHARREAEAEIAVETEANL